MIDSKGHDFGCFGLVKAKTAVLGSARWRATGLALLGTAAMRPLLFPLAFLIFALPLGDGLIPGLQDFSARFAVKLLSASGIPVLLEGRYITVPHRKWEVAEVGSGVRYLIASLAVGFLFAGVIYRSWARRVGFFLASAIIPILANGVRIYAIVAIGYLGGDRLALGVDHIGRPGFLLDYYAAPVSYRDEVAGRSETRRASAGGREEFTAIRGEVKVPLETAYFTPRAGLLLAGMLILIALGSFSAKHLWSYQPGPEEVSLAGRQGSVAIVLTAENAPPQSQGSAILRDFLNHAAWQESLRLPLRDLANSVNLRGIELVPGVGVGGIDTA